MKNIKVLIIILFCSISLYSQTPTWSWAKTAICGMHSWSNVVGSISSDNVGNIYATGGCDSCIFGISIVNGFFLAKYNSAGNIIWEKSLQGVITGNITINLADDIFVIGIFQDTGIFGIDTIFNGFNGGYYISKFDTSGNIIWAKSVGYLSNYASSNCWGNPLDSANNIYISGYFTGSNAVFGNDTLTQGGFIVKYDSSGNELWAKSAGGDSSDYSKCIATDLFGDIYIGGTFYSDSIEFGNTTLYNSHPGFVFGPPPSGVSNIFVAKLGSSLTGINNNVIKENNIIIFPNPTNSSFTIKIPQETKYVQVSNSLGQVLEKRIVKNKTELNFAIRENGIYFVQVVTEKKIFTKKLIIDN